MKLLDFPQLIMIVLYVAIQKTRDFNKNLSSNIARGDISRAGIIFFIRLSTAGINRMRALFKGGSYMRKYCSVTGGKNNLTFWNQFKIP